MASVLEIAKGKRISIALENYSTTNATDFVIGLGSLAHYESSKYDTNNRRWIFASKWLSSPGIAIEQDGVTVNPVGANEIERYDTLRNYFSLYNFLVKDLRIEGVSGLVSSQIKLKSVFLSSQSEDIDQTIDIDPYQNQSDIYVGQFPLVIGRDGGIILRVKAGNNQGPTVVQVQFTISEIIPLSGDVFLGNVVGSGGSLGGRSFIGPVVPMGGGKGVREAIPLNFPSGGGNNTPPRPSNQIL